MQYNLYFRALMCDRFVCDFMKACDLGVDGVGVECEICLTVNDMPKDIHKIEELLESTKDNKELEKYYMNVKHIRTEIIEEDKL